MTASSVPNVLGSLVTAFTGYNPFVGEPVQEQPTDFVAVGWNGPDNAAVVNTRQLSGLALTQQREEYDVICQVVAWQGDANLAACVLRAYAALDHLVDTLAADKTLAGSCQLAAITSDELMPNQTQQGAMATLSVTVHVTAFRL